MSNHNDSYTYYGHSQISSKLVFRRPNSGQITFTSYDDTPLYPYDEVSSSSASNSSNYSSPAPYIIPSPLLTSVLTLDHSFSSAFSSAVQLPTRELPCLSIDQHNGLEFFKGEPEIAVQIKTESPSESSSRATSVSLSSKRVVTRPTKRARYIQPLSIVPEYDADSDNEGDEEYRPEPEIHSPPNNHRKRRRVQTEASGSDIQSSSNDQKRRRGQTQASGSDKRDSTGRTFTKTSPRNKIAEETVLSDIESLIKSQSTNMNCMKCPMGCGTFDRKPDFIRHLKTHLPEELKSIISCQFCHRTFSRRDALRRHEIVKHSSKLVHKSAKWAFGGEKRRSRHV